MSCVDHSGMMSGSKRIGAPTDAQTHKMFQVKTGKRLEGTRKIVPGQTIR